MLVRGIRGPDLARLGSIANNIQQGTLDGFDDGQGVAIGARLAEQLSVHAGDNVTLVSPRGAVTPLGTTPRIKPYDRGGLRDRHVGIRPAFVYMPLPEAQAYFNRDGEVTAIEVYVDNPDHVDRCRREIQEAAQRPIYMTDWHQRNETFFSALQVERNVMFLILTLIMLVAALNIISGLIMLVKDKGQDIAILRTMGATRGAIMRIFLITGASIGVVGTVVGFLLGVLVCLNIETIRQFLSWLTSTELSRRSSISSPGCRPTWTGRDHRGRRHGVDLSFLATLYPPGAPPGSIRSRRCATSDLMPDDTPAIYLTGVERRYRQGDATLEILDRRDLAVWGGQSVALVAPSGAGKSTLLHIAGLLEHPDAGEVYITDRRPPRSTTPRARGCGAPTSASSISSTICCRSSPRSRTS